jgi:hypothetical protein
MPVQNAEKILFNGGQKNESTTNLRKKAKILDAAVMKITEILNTVAKVGDITELTEELARMFIEKIVVHEAVFKEGTKRVKISQEVDVYFAYIGQFNPNGELEELRGEARNGNLIYVN